MNKKEKAFVETVWQFYKSEGRHTLPWRQDTHPYKVLVSELMLQQTQVERVIPKFEAFIEKWPTVQALAQASLGEVLQQWQGLGYNRRAKFLHQTAKVVADELDGVFPDTRESLLTLPGVGPYTAGAIQAFSFNSPVVLIETNVRRVYIHHFFTLAEAVSDAEILPLVEKTLPKDSARDWYSALMDYGTHLKKTVVNPNRRSAHYTKQAKFVGSDRQIRGAIIKLFSQNIRLDEQSVVLRLSEYEKARVVKQLQSLMHEGMLEKGKQYYSFPAH